jgi:hypothetical protein
MSKVLLRHLVSVLFIALLPASTCNNGRKVTPNPPVITDQGDCEAACSNLKALGCREGDPIDMNTKCNVDADCLGLDGKPDSRQQCSALGTCYVSCTNFCIETENQGVWLDPTCVKNIKSCSEINSCPKLSDASEAGTAATSCTGPTCQ